MNDVADNSISNDEELNQINFHHVDGEQKGEVILFALSTCGWCKKTRMFLEENEIAYNYIYVDLTTGEERELVVSELEKYNPDESFPTLIINGQIVVGFEPDEMASLLNIED